jgi:hypothetical protein
MPTADFGIVGLPRSFGKELDPPARNQLIIDVHFSFKPSRGMCVRSRTATANQESRRDEGAESESRSAARRSVLRETVIAARSARRHLRILGANLTEEQFDELIFTRNA